MARIGTGIRRCNVARKLGGGDAGGAAVGLDDIPAGDDIARGELFEEQAGERPYIPRIDLHEIARSRGRIVPRFADGIRADGSPSMHRDGQPRRFDEEAGGPESGEDTINGFGGKADTFTSQEDAQFLAPPAGILLAQGVDPVDDGSGKHRTAKTMRASGAGFESAQIRGNLAAAPAK